ncbi:hypothetical protein BY458DRAFT_503101 [Sporodiniella umbellata]|nr:hypothetical protein BY458DRAFT_503101 [Sporodiniella umbellata]
MGFFKFRKTTKNSFLKNTKAGEDCDFNVLFEDNKLIKEATDSQSIQDDWINRNIDGEPLKVTLSCFIQKCIRMALNKSILCDYISKSPKPQFLDSTSVHSTFSTFILSVESKLSRTTCKEPHKRRSFPKTPRSPYFLNNSKSYRTPYSFGHSAASGTVKNLCDGFLPKKKISVSSVRSLVEKSPITASPNSHDPAMIRMKERHRKECRTPHYWRIYSERNNSNSKKYVCKTNRVINSCQKLSSGVGHLSDTKKTNKSLSLKPLYLPRTRSNMVPIANPLLSNPSTKTALVSQRKTPCSRDKQVQISMNIQIAIQ